MVYPGSGTGGWEAALVNTLSPGDQEFLRYIEAHRGKHSVNALYALKRSIVDAGEVGLHASSSTPDSTPAPAVTDFLQLILTGGRIIIRVAQFREKKWLRPRCRWRSPPGEASIQ